MADKSGTTILVVDDAPENIQLLSRIFSKCGYQIQVAENGAQAVEIAQATLPDIILLDINMPVLGGFEACVQLKKDERTCDIPVIFISALDSIDDKSNGFRVGGVDYILKPFEYEEVQARVETHLALRHLRVQLEQANQALAVRVEELTNSRELLAERERRLSAFVNALPNLSFVLDEQGHYLEVIANETSLLAARPDQLIGRLIEEVLPPKENAKIMDAIGQTIQTGKIQVIEYRIPVISGGERWFEGRVALMEKGDLGSGKVVFMASDITERIQLYHEVQRLANLDVLTGCFNRRHFMEKAAQEIHRAMRYNRPLSLLMMDIDHFKDVNDQNGHQVGDQLLCNLVLLCQKQLRNDDILGRYGGEEFVVLMPETPSEGAMLASERLRINIEKMKINTAKGSLSVTVSMGLASLERGFDKTHTLDTLIKSADLALYAAKAAGRNCVKTE
jgi:diguanylate cyclase (GGDEF)-like protein/PAS domain S-box-containing protein